MLDEEMYETLIESGHRAQMTSHNIEALIEEKIICLSCFLQFVDRVDEEAPTEVLCPDARQNLTESPTWHTNDLSVS